MPAFDSVFPPHRLPRALREYLSYEALRGELDRVVALFPAACTVERKVLGHTPEGREILALHVWPRGRGVDQPTLWVDANMHSAELIGANVVLAQAESLAAVADQEPWRSVNYVFVPRICPDGAECYFTTGIVNRSNPRDGHSDDELGAHWKRACLVEKRPRPETRLSLLTSPRRVGVMRRRNPAGVWTMDEECPTLVRRRAVGDGGPFYDVFPEGTVANWDGMNLPPAFRTDRNETDLNRNFPWLWTADRRGVRGGTHPGSEPESRAIIAYSSTIPQLYFWLNYHTFGGVYIRPPEDKPDSSLPRLDASVYEIVDRELERITGYPAVSGHAEFLYEPGVPLPGTLTDWAYYGLGAYSYVCELWDLPARLGRTQRPFINRYTLWDTAQWRKLWLFDKNVNGGLLFGHPWLPYDHPQLGQVEVSELPSVFGIQNPPQALIEEVVRPQIDVFHLLVRLAPRPTVGLRVRTEQTSILTVANEGFLPTYVSKQKDKVMGAQRILVHTAKGTHPLEDLDGHVPVNTGWIDFAGGGSNARTSAAMELPAAEAKSVRVSFPRAGTLVPKGS